MQLQARGILPPVISIVAMSLGYFFVVMELKRNPREFFDALHRIDKIAACRRALEEAGLQYTLLSGAKVYVPPEHHRRVLERLSDRHLNARHIIVAEEFRDAVVDAISSIPRRGKLQIRFVKEDLVVA